MWHDLLAALGLVLVIEGLLPFANPRRLREALMRLARLDDRALRLGGLLSMAAGLATLYLIR